MTQREMLLVPRSQVAYRTAQNRRAVVSDFFYAQNGPSALFAASQLQFLGCRIKEAKKKAASPFFGRKGSGCSAFRAKNSLYR